MFFYVNFFIGYTIIMLLLFLLVYLVGLGIIDL